MASSCGLSITRRDDANGMMPKFYNNFLVYKGVNFKFYLKWLKVQILLREDFIEKGECHS